MFSNILRVLNRAMILLLEKEENNIRKQYYYDKYNWVPSLPI